MRRHAAGASIRIVLSILGNRVYRHLLLAQIVSLLGTGLATVALALVAHDLAGPRAASVLGTALAIKMLAYIAIGPWAASLAGIADRRRLLVALDLVRVPLALALPFVSAEWHVYLVIGLLQSASALFSPTFQATIPDILTDERDYTRALSLSRLAYDLEALASPAIAAALLTVMTFHALFAGTAAGFMVSALLVLSVRLPSPQPAPDRGWLARAKVGFVVFARTPRLRGLMALNLAVAAPGAIVLVDTVLAVREVLARPEQDVAVALACFGAGSMLAALVLPRLLDRVSDRSVMLAGGVAAPLVLAALAVLPPRWSALLIAWSLIGLCYGALLTPTGRLLRRSAAARDRPGLFAAQFALSHAAWLVTYPLAGWTATHGGLAMAFVLHGAIGLAAALTAALLWPARDPVAIEHDHDLPPDHPHLAGGALRHSHPYVIDVLHPRWPRRR
jgi:MFS family permease